MSKTTIMFGVHNKQIKVYAIMGKERKNKALSFFGDNYKVETSVEYWEKANQCPLKRRGLLLLQAVRQSRASKV